MRGSRISLHVRRALLGRGIRLLEMRSEEGNHALNRMSLRLGARQRVALARVLEARHFRAVRLLVERRHVLQALFEREDQWAESIATVHMCPLLV